jgi:hypothetical protein
MPNPLYQLVRDHLERAMATLPRHNGTEPLRGLIDEAIDVAIELAYLRRPDDAPVLRLLPSDTGERVMR